LLADAQASGNVRTIHAAAACAVISVSQCANPERTPAAAGTGIEHAHFATGPLRDHSKPQVAG